MQENKAIGACYENSSTSAEKRIRELLNLHATQLNFMPFKGATDVLFVVKRMQDKYRYKFVYVLS